MAKNIARYAVTFGLTGCYMPNSGPFTIEHTTRRDLADFIRRELAFFEMPANAMRQISIKHIWSHIARHGSSSAHFSIDHKGYTLAFHGLTDEEYKQAVKEGEA